MIAADDDTTMFGLIRVNSGCLAHDRRLGSLLWSKSFRVGDDALAHVRAFEKARCNMHRAFAPSNLLAVRSQAHDATV